MSPRFRGAWLDLASYTTAMLRAPRIHGPSGIGDLGVDGIGVSVAWLREALQLRKVRLHPDSRMARALIRVEELADKGARDDTVTFPDVVEAWRWYIDAAGLDFLARALHRAEVEGLEGFDSYFRKLASGDPVLTGPAGQSSNDRNGSWEFLLACLVAPFATAVRPGEPDVLCDFAGETVGLAAKVLYSRDAKKHLDRILEGAEQIQRSVASYGFVVVNLVEVFPHLAMLDNFLVARMSTNDQAVHVIDQWVTVMLSLLDVRRMTRKLREFDKTLAILCYLPTVVSMHGLPNPLVTYHRVHVFSIEGRESRTVPFAYALNKACREVLMFRPDAAAVGF